MKNMEIIFFKVSNLSARFKLFYCFAFLQVLTYNTCTAMIHSTPLHNILLTYCLTILINGI